MNYCPWCLETERLLIRPMYPTDASFYIELVNTPKFIENIGERNIHTPEAAKKHIEEKMLSQLRRTGYSNYSLIRKSDGKIVGVAGIFNRDGLDECDLGFGLLPEFERQGYAYEGSSKVLSMAFEHYELPSLSAITIEKNKSSRNLLEKLGFHFQEIIRLPNDPEDLMLYRIFNT